jgi:hypothetical protein
LKSARIRVALASGPAPTRSRISWAWSFRFARVLDNHAAPIHLRRKLLDLAHHHAPDPLLSQIARHDDVVDADGVRCEADRGDGDDVAEELAEEAVGGEGADRELLELEKPAHRLVIGGVDGAHKKAKSAHSGQAKWRNAMLLQHILIIK